MDRSHQQVSIDIPSLLLSIVICCHSLERLEDVRKAIRSALNQTFSRREVIVAVDHNQELLDLLRAELPATVKVVPNTGVRGLSDTRNAGICSAEGDIIAFIDDDAVAAPDCMEKLVQQYGVRSVAGVGGRSVPAWENGRPAWFPEELDWVVGSTYKGAPEGVSQVVRLIGCNMSFRRGVFDTVGMFDTGLGRTGTSGEGEDSEICMRIRDRIPGSILLYEPAAIVYHRVPAERATFGYLVSRSYSGGKAVASIRRMYSAPEQGSMSTAMERSYLGYLYSTAVPARLRQVYRKQALAELAAILASVVATGLGYLAGHTKRPGPGGTKE